MKVQVLSLVAMFVATVAAPSFAQEKRVQDPNGYVSGFGGAAWADGNSTGSVLFEGGVRVAPHVTAFGNIGRFANLKGDLQPTLDAATTALSEQGLGGDQRRNAPGAGTARRSSRRIPGERSCVAVCPRWSWCGPFESNGAVHVCERDNARWLNA